MQVIADHLRKQFDQNVVLSDVCLEIPEGEITIVMGPSGTGKSVFLSHIIGLLMPDAGSLMVDGRPVADRNQRELNEMRKRMGMLFQDGALFSSINVFDNIALPLRKHTDLSETKVREIVRARLKDVGLSGTESRMPNELSGGMRKRAGLARALVMDPELLLFDEPDSGLDPVRTRLLCDLIEDTWKAKGGTYVIVSHDVTEVARTGHRIAILWQGEVRQFGPREDVYNSRDPFVHQFMHGTADGPLTMD
ncbi:MAG: phospholipid/cholesterol/gamma-HCH transport system ATP-binding protein [Chloroflexota bacterium]|jgi:phospholipid/cholesterol/gamma-HCH transport system ATP-binding protein|nr:phospholipid/cholesterol/gamma-HCH transport system ATP-binding protein [Chloroflexota bacterium]